MNLSSLASDTGISVPPPGLALRPPGRLPRFLARPYFTNVSKRLIQAPRIYFTDPGLAAWLVGIRTEEHLHAHPLRGALVENGNLLHAIEAKSGKTVPFDAFKGLDSWRPELRPGKSSRSWLVYGGDTGRHRESVTVPRWQGLTPLRREI